MTKRRDKCEPGVELLVLHQNDLECCSSKSFRDSDSFSPIKWPFCNFSYLIHFDKIPQNRDFVSD